MDHRHLAHVGLVAVVSSLLSAAAVADGTRHEEKLVAMSTTAMSITGDMRLVKGRDGVVSKMIFQNGRSLTLGGGTQGVYRVAPPANPSLLRGNRLCSGLATGVALQWGLHGAVSMAVYQGRKMTPQTLCGTFNYLSKG